MEKKMIDGVWEKANEVSKLGYKGHSASDIVELVAEKISTDAESGALWAAADLLKDLSDRLETLALDIMQLNREHEEAQNKLIKKGKKK